jgi:hypothetical protein
MAMFTYPVLEQDGFCVSVSTRREPTKRWRAWVQFERDRDYAKLGVHSTEPLRVPVDYPSEERAVQAAYAHARTLIAHELQNH